MGEYTARNISAAPAELVTNGIFNLGTFNAPVRTLNPLSARDPLKLPLPGIINDLRLKEWQAYQFGNEDWFGLTVLYNTKTVAMIQFIMYDKKERELYKYERMVPAWNVSLPKSLYGTHSVFNGDGFHIDYDNRLDQNMLGIQAAAGGFKDLPELRASLKGYHDGRTAPMAVCMPFEPGRAMYSHKCLMPMDGEVHLGNRVVSFDQKDSFLIVDDHKAYYPFKLQYDWVTGAKYDRKLIGFNFTDNQVPDQESYNENCIWLDGKLHLMPPVKFNRPGGVKGDWFVQDQYGLVDLVFTPVVQNDVVFNFGVLQSDYHGPYGVFRGTLKLPGKGKEIDLKGYFGMGEQKMVMA